MPFAPDAEPSSVLAVVRREPRAQVVHLEEAKDLVRSSTSPGFCSRQPGSAIVESRPVPCAVRGVMFPAYYFQL